MDLKHLELIRLSELEGILTEIKSEKPGRNRILEIGAGIGCQAKKLYENGNTVEAIDIEDSTYSENRIWPILNYDGERIPFPDGHFDIVFSSNVLEHIAHLSEFQNEIKRVLKPNGLAIHVVPSGTWRFWTNVAHYAFIFKTFINIIYNKATSRIGRPSKIGSLKKAILPPRHGEIGTAVSEMYYFSRRRWHTIFKRSGWEVKKYFPNGLFYTGYMILGSMISIQFRKYLSYFFGSSCHIFVLIKGKLWSDQIVEYTPRATVRDKQRLRRTTYH